MVCHIIDTPHIARIFCAATLFLFSIFRADLSIGEQDQFGRQVSTFLPLYALHFILILHPSGTIFIFCISSRFLHTLSISQCIRKRSHSEYKFRLMCSLRTKP